MISGDKFQSSGDVCEGEKVSCLAPPREQIQDIKRVSLSVPNNLNKCENLTKVKKMCHIFQNNDINHCARCHCVLLNLMSLTSFCLLRTHATLISEYLPLKIQTQRNIFAHSDIFKHFEENIIQNTFCSSASLQFCMTSQSYTVCAFVPITSLMIKGKDIEFLNNLQ